MAVIQSILQNTVKDEVIINISLTPAI
jgi:hypothetical protein